MTNTRAKSPETPLRTHAGTDHLLQTADHKPVSAAASIEFLHPVSAIACIGTGRANPNSQS
jgi:hypothetical protein